jgi:ribose/xylose/arabinose/galactoside ABC-type transport system permease subunit
MSQSSPAGGSGPRAFSTEFGLAIAVAVVVCATAVLDSNHSYWHSPGLSAQEIVRQTVILGIFALGSAIVIIAGGIDLSSGSMIAFGGATFASVLLLLSPENIKANDLATGHIALAILATLSVGFLVGSLHAWLITSIGLPPFVATLATLVGLRSLGRAMVEAVNRLMLKSSSTQINVQDSEFRSWINSIPLRTTIFLCLAVALWVLMSRTVTGRRLYALGGNETATRLSGIRTERLKWLAYCLSAMCSSIAGILYVGEQSVADPQSLGRGYELNAIAAAVVGGCSLQGGIGTIPGVMLGCLFLRVVIDGIAKVIKTGADLYEGLIVGIVVAVAVTFSQIRGAAGRGKQFFSGALGGVAVIALALLASLILALFVGRMASAIGGLAALMLLGGAKLWEHRRANG